MEAVGRTLQDVINSNNSFWWYCSTLERGLQVDSPGG